MSEATTTTPLARLEAWSNGHKARSVEIESPNGYGAGCWSVTLGHERGTTQAAEVSFWTRPPEKGGEVAYRAECEKVGVVFARNIGDRGWPGLEATITAALDAFDRGVFKELKPVAGPDARRRTEAEVLSRAGADAIERALRLRDGEVDELRRRLNLPGGP